MPGLIEPHGLTLMRDAADAILLTAFGFHRVVQVGHTISGIASVEPVSRFNVSEVPSLAINKFCELGVIDSEFCVNHKYR